VYESDGTALSLVPMNRILWYLEQTFRGAVRGQWGEGKERQETRNDEREGVTRVKRV
jgi:hypothetical protein